MVTILPREILLGLVFAALSSSSLSAQSKLPTLAETTEWLTSKLPLASYEWAVVDTDTTTGVYYRRAVHSAKFRNCTLAIETSEDTGRVVSRDVPSNEVSKFVDLIDFSVVNKVAMSLEGNPGVVAPKNVLAINPGMRFIRIRFYSGSGLPEITRTRLGGEPFRLPDTHIGFTVSDRNEQLAKRIMTAFEHLIKVCTKPERF